MNKEVNIAEDTDLASLNNAGMFRERLASDTARNIIRTMHTMEAI